MIDVDKFISEQLDAWPMALKNFCALKGVDVKPVGWALAQFNPARIVSTGAKVDAAALKKRPCFLCEANRPPQQYGIQWGDYEILINPFPIFPRHLTIPLRSHSQQSIKGRVADMCRLAIEMPGYTVFYNGPKCGASAPDHMHFQAGNSDFLPIWGAIGQMKAIAPSISVPVDGNCMPGMLIIDADTPQEAEKAFDRVYDSLAKRQLNVLADQGGQPEGAEPMMNVLCVSQAGKPRIVVIPRKKHRPSFYGDGDGQMVLSPASVDLAGVFITPRKVDFDAFDADVMQRTLAELCFTPAEVESLEI